jgi:hypothetical protein
MLQTQKAVLIIFSSSVSFRSVVSICNIWTFLLEDIARFTFQFTYFFREAIGCFVPCSIVPCSCVSSLIPRSFPWRVSSLLSHQLVHNDTYEEIKVWVNFYGALDNPVFRSWPTEGPLYFLWTGRRLLPYSVLYWTRLCPFPENRSLSEQYKKTIKHSLASVYG